MFQKMRPFYVCLKDKPPLTYHDATWRYYRVNRILTCNPIVFQPDWNRGSTTAVLDRRRARWRISTASVNRGESRRTAACPETQSCPLIGERLQPQQCMVKCQQSSGSSACSHSRRRFRAFQQHSGKENVVSHQNFKPGRPDQATVLKVQLRRVAPSDALILVGTSYYFYRLGHHTKLWSGLGAILSR